MANEFTDNTAESDRSYLHFIIIHLYVFITSALPRLQGLRLSKSGSFWGLETKHEKGNPVIGAN